MPTPTLVIGAPCWIDLYWSDTEKATEFYGGLFGWTTETQREEFGGYFTFLKDGKHVGGCMANDGQQGMPDVWTTYLTTDDVERTAADAEGEGRPGAHGADAGGGERLLRDHRRPGRRGHRRVAAGPGLGLRDLERARRAEVVRAAHHSDYDATVDFYRDVFGWNTNTYSDKPEFRYTTLRSGADDLAGIMDASQFCSRAPPALDDLLRRRGHGRRSRAGRRARRQGREEAKDTPWGRLAEAADPTGTAFKLMASS